MRNGVSPAGHSPASPARPRRGASRDSSPGAGRARTSRGVRRPCPAAYPVRVSRLTLRAPGICRRPVVLPDPVFMLRVRRAPVRSIVLRSGRPACRRAPVEGRWIVVSCSGAGVWHACSRAARPACVLRRRGRRRTAGPVATEPAMADRRPGSCWLPGEAGLQAEGQLPGDAGGVAGGLARWGMGPWRLAGNTRRAARSETPRAGRVTRGKATILRCWLRRRRAAGSGADGWSRVVGVAQVVGVASR